MRPAAALAVIVFLAAGTPLPPSGHAMPTSDETLIREARARSNAAIAAHDTARIAAEWMPDLTVVASTSAVTTGREANAEGMAGRFAERPDLKWVRTPDTIEVLAPWDVASERGHWVGTWTDPDGPVEIGGTYQAQWRKSGERWLIRGELFVPTYCHGGAYCRSHP